MAAWSASNRFEAKIRSYQQRGEPILPEDFTQPTVPAERNAGPAYIKAADAMNAALTPQERQNFERTFNGDDPLTDAQRDVIRQTLGKSIEPLRFLRAARGLPVTSWDLSFVSPVSQTFMSGPIQGQFNAMRSMSNLLRAAALDAFDRGDHAAGVEYVLDIVAIARAVDRMPPTLVTHMVANGIDAIAAETALDVAPDLRTDAAKPARELVDELFTDKPRRDAFARAWQGERMIRADTVRTLAKDSTFGGFLFKLDGVRLLDQADQIAAAASRPTLQSARAMFPAPPPPRGIGRLTRPLSFNTWPSMDRSLENEAKSTVLRRAAATALALRLYALEHDGKLPPTLIALVSKYIPMIPMDPYSPGNAQLGYAPGGDDPKLYSVGLNAFDDGGSELTTLPSQPPQRWDGIDYVFHLKRQPAVLSPLPPGEG